ncbi:MAG: DUF4191 domain-containing protein [Actinomycetota bacterium]|nr:DUF4191 domain-containing protein [Actinomycetota bacterium]
MAKQRSGPASKKAVASKKDAAKPRRIAQIRQSYRVTKGQDPKIGWILLGVFLVPALAAFAVAWLVLKAPVFGALFGVLLGFLAVLIVFGRRAQRAALKEIEGKPGAAAAALGLLRRGWHTDPAIGFTKQQDVVHRLVGPPGIILIGEGNVNRLRPLMSSERRKHERVVSETPIHEVVVGDHPGEVPLNKLARHVTKLGRKLKPAQMTDVLQRLKALDANRPPIPMPKGPVPTSMHGARQNLRGR